MQHQRFSIPSLRSNALAVDVKAWGRFRPVLDDWNTRRIPGQRYSQGHRNKNAWKLKGWGCEGGAGQLVCNDVFTKIPRCGRPKLFAYRREWARIWKLNRKRWVEGGGLVRWEPIFVMGIKINNSNRTSDEPQEWPHGSSAAFAAWGPGRVRRANRRFARGTSSPLTSAVGRRSRNWAASRLAGSQRRRLCRVSGCEPGSLPAAGPNRPTPRSDSRSPLLHCKSLMIDIWPRPPTLPVPLCISPWSAIDCGPAFSEDKSAASWRAY